MENIAIIITKLNGGGAERCASNLSVELSRKYNVFLIVFDGRNITYPYKGTFIDLKIADSGNFFKRSVNVLRRASAVRKIKKKYNIKCSISLLDGPNIVNVLSKRGEKTIVSIRNRLSSENVGALRKKLIVFSSLHSDLTVCLSKMVEKDMKEYFGIPENKFTCIYNHVDSELLKSLAQSSEKPDFIKEGRRYIATMGRLNMQKGQWHLIRLFKKVSEVCKDTDLIILGEGELKEKLQNLASELGIKDRVIFTGYIKNPHSVLKYCDVFAFPSLFEGLGNVLLEALAFGMPIVSADCIAGPREILAPQTDLNSKIKKAEYEEFGVLTPEFDKGEFNSLDPLTDSENEMAEAIINLLSDDKLRESYKSKAVKRADFFNKESVIGQWCKVISE